MGRNQSDNERIKKLQRPEDAVLRCTSFSGPLGLVSGDFSDEELRIAASLVASYGKGKDEAEVDVVVTCREQTSTLQVVPMERSRAEDFKVE